MSFHRENITWQSQDKTWNIGFWEFYEIGSRDDEEFDPEWDVEYRGDAFWFASTGHSTPESAMEAYTRRNCNPATTTEVPYKGHAVECKQYDKLAMRFKNPELAKKEDEAEDRKLARAHLKKLTEEFIAKGFSTGRVRVQVVLVTDPKTVHSRMGMTTSVYGFLDREGDWITVDKKKVFNTKTQKIASNVYSVEVASQSSYSYRRFY